MRHLAFLALLVSACGSSPAASNAAVSNTAPRMTSTAPTADHACPSAQPKIDSSCESFQVGQSCLYADQSVGCSCVGTNPSQRSADNPSTQIWDCGEHGESE